MWHFLPKAWPPSLLSFASKRLCHSQSGLRVELLTKYCFRGFGVISLCYSCLPSCKFPESSSAFHLLCICHSQESPFTYILWGYFADSIKLFLWGSWCLPSMSLDKYFVAICFLLSPPPQIKIVWLWPREVITKLKILKAIFDSVLCLTCPTSNQLPFKGHSDSCICLLILFLLPLSFPAPCHQFGLSFPVVWTT